MLFHDKISPFFMVILFFGCSANIDQQSSHECNRRDKEIILGVWSNPRFIPNSSNCYFDECLEVNFELNSDSSYQLSYEVYDSSTNLTLRVISDRGNFDFDCMEAGNLSGKFSSLRYTKGKLILSSDSLPEKEWTIEYNGIEGLILQPEYLGFTHDASIRLN